MKDELDEKTMKEFAALRAKIQSYLKTKIKKLKAQKVCRKKKTRI